MCGAMIWRFAGLVVWLVAPYFWQLQAAVDMQHQQIGSLKCSIPVTLQCNIGTTTRIAAHFTRSFDTLQHTCVHKMHPWSDSPLSEGVTQEVKMVLGEMLILMYPPSWHLSKC